MSEQEKIYAGFWVRLFAGILDCIFLSPLVFMLIYVSGNTQTESFHFESALQTYEFIGATAHNSFANLVTINLVIKR